MRVILAGNRVLLLVQPFRVATNIMLIVLAGNRVLIVLPFRVDLWVCVWGGGVRA